MLIQSDYHIHASFYRFKAPGDTAGPRAAEQVASARASGSVYVGIVEHCNASPRHPFHCLKELSAEYYADDFDRENVFLGVEADLEEDGSDACGRSGREELRLHYVIGSSHLSPSLIPDVGSYIESEFKRITNALKYNDNIDIIGHPFGEGIRWERAGVIQQWQWSLIPENYLDEIVRLAGKSGKALEINRSDFTDPVYCGFLQRIRDNGVLFTAGSDAHATAGTAEVIARTQKLADLGFSENNHWKVEI